MQIARKIEKPNGTKIELPRTGSKNSKSKDNKKIKQRKKIYQKAEKVMYMLYNAITLLKLDDANFDEPP